LWQRTSLLGTNLLTKYSDEQIKWQVHCLLL